MAAPPGEVAPAPLPTPIVAPPGFTPTVPSGAVPPAPPVGMGAPKVLTPPSDFVAAEPALDGAEGLVGVGGLGGGVVTLDAPPGMAPPVGAVPAAAPPEVPPDVPPDVPPAPPGAAPGVEPEADPAPDGLPEPPGTVPCAEVDAEELPAPDAPEPPAAVGMLGTEPGADVDAGVDAEVDGAACPPLITVFSTAGTPGPWGIFTAAPGTAAHGVERELSPCHPYPDIVSQK